ncbi:MAG TPA: sigma-54 dependent transcriptional regulator [Pirellulales bacterium]|jgi:two-component system nitrogen regulation response regulator GlnG|nr:sigma-54 dependent transcriptional regulator [Pirellulales bacterium]
MSNARVPTEHHAQNNGKGSPQATLEALESPEPGPTAPAEQAPAVVLVVDDDRAVRHTIRRIFEETPLEILTAENAEEGLKIASQRHPDVILLDVMLPDRSGLDMFEKFHELDAKVPVIFITAGEKSDTVIKAMKLGAYEYLVKPLDSKQVRSLVNRAVEIRRSTEMPAESVEATAEEEVRDYLVGRSPAMQEVYKAIGRVASQDVTVLIHGESGTGKELVARAIYQHSARSKGPFLAVNCAAIPESLLESELFGHEKGSFTGAESRRIGKFEQCNGGTLFLDEIGDMSPLVQSKMLRLLQEQAFERVGGNETIRTNVRIIVATNRDLEQMVKRSEFRADLYYRLNGFVIKLPALRERKDDVLVLLQHFLRHFSRELGKKVHGISPEALELLLWYPWPGNVRELQSVLKRALLQTTGEVLISDFLPEDVRTRAGHGGASGDQAADVTPVTEAYIDTRIREGSEDLYAEAVALLERALITRVLQHTKGNQSQAAKILGITRGSLRNKIRTCGIAIEHVVMSDKPAGVS